MARRTAAVVRSDSARTRGVDPEPTPENPTPKLTDYLEVRERRTPRRGTQEVPRLRWSRMRRPRKILKGEICTTARRHDVGPGGSRLGFW